MNEPPGRLWPPYDALERRALNMGRSVDRLEREVRRGACALKDPQCQRQIDYAVAVLLEIRKRPILDGDYVLAALAIREFFRAEKLQYYDFHGDQLEGMIAGAQFYDPGESVQHFVGTTLLAGEHSVFFNDKVDVLSGACTLAGRLLLELRLDLHSAAALAARAIVRHYVLARRLERDNLDGKYFAAKVTDSVELALRSAGTVLEAGDAIRKQLEALPPRSNRREKNAYTEWAAMLHAEGEV